CPRRVCSLSGLGECCCARARCRVVSSVARTPRPGISTLSLHDALPISSRTVTSGIGAPSGGGVEPSGSAGSSEPTLGSIEYMSRSEEHTSELQSHLNLVCRLLLEKKKKSQKIKQTVQKTQLAEEAPEG